MVAMKSRTITQTDSDSTMKQVASMFAQLNAVLADWPNAEDLLVQRAGFGGEEGVKTKSIIQGECDRITSLIKKGQDDVLKSLREAVKTLDKLLNGLPNPDANEGQYRAYFQQGSVSTQFARLQQKLKEGIEKGDAIFNISGEEFGNVHPDLRKSAVEREAKSMYHVCLYTSLMFYRNADTFKPTKAGEAKKKKMMSVLETLDGSEGLRKYDEEVDYKIVKEMRKELKCPKASDEDKGASQQTKDKKRALGGSSAAASTAVPAAPSRATEAPNAASAAPRASAKRRGQGRRRRQPQLEVQSGAAVSDSD